MRCAQELPVDLFELLSKHLGVCGREYQRIRAKEQRRYRCMDRDRDIESTYQHVCHVLSRKFFTRVFGDCDPENVSLLELQGTKYRYTDNIVRELADESMHFLTSRFILVQIMLSGKDQSVTNQNGQPVAND